VSSIDSSTALDVLSQLHEQLGDVDADARAVVALARLEDGTVSLEDVAIHDNGILEAPEHTDGLVVVTSEDVELADDQEVVSLRQLVCILPDGTEVGVFQLGDDPTPRTWSTTDDPTSAMRPRDLASNTARRALGLGSVVEPPPVADLLARAWLLGVAREALTLFDAADGPREVEPPELEDVAARAPLPGVDADEIPTWEEVHRLAAEGHLEVGPFAVDAQHAAWLDVDGLAQVLDQTLPSTEELLGSLRLVGDDDLLAWAIGWLSARDWYQPADDAGDERD
jgi:hypothetical protein